MPIDSYILGQKQLDFAKVEASYDTLQSFVAGDAVKLLSLKLQPEYPLEDTKEHTGSGSRNGVIPGRKSGTWSASGYFYLGAAGVAPACKAFLQGAYGKETVVGGTSVTYTLDNSQAPKSLQLGQLVDDNFYHVATGCIVEQLVIKSGNERPTWDASGSFATYGSVSACKVAAAGADAGAAAVPLLAAHAGAVMVNAVVQIGTRTNEGAGYTVTAVSADGATITVSPVLEGAVLENDVIKPLLPSPTFAGALMGIGSSSLTLAGRSLRYSEHALTMITGRHARDGEAMSDRPTGIIPGAIKVDGQLNARFVDSDYGPFVGRAWAVDPHALVNRVGPNTAAARFTLNAPNAYFDVAQPDFPDEGEAVLQLKYRAHQASAEHDEHTLVFD
jgi:hypothetical protein